jgi:glycosyltransferase involved in cell wall biosynthesis
VSAPAILLSDTVWSPRRQRGVSRCFGKVREAVATAFGDRVVVCSPRRAPGPARQVRSLAFPGSRWLGVHDRWASRLARRLRAGLFYSPYYGRARPRIAEVYTVYDMIHELFPRHFSPSQPTYRDFMAEKAGCIERAAALIAISERTRQDVLRLHPRTDPARITVAPLGVDDVFFESGGPAPTRPARPYFLFVGPRKGYKNFSRLVEALAVSGLAREMDLRVLSPEARPFMPEEVDRMRRLGLLEAVHLSPELTDAALREAYAGAVALACPSEYEGFGLPVLEAMASGTLVAASNAGSLPEVGGTAASYFDPARPESIAQVLQEVAGLGLAERAARIERGRNHARAFSWTRFQEHTVAVFRGVLGES